MSELFKGVVQRLNFKEIDEDQFGNLFRASMLLKLQSGEEQWVNLGGKKKDEINIKQGSGWHKLAVGDAVEVVAEDSEYQGKTYWKASTATLKVKGSAPVQSSSAPSSRGSQTNSSKTSPVNSGGSVDWAKKDAGIEAGHAVNCAVALLGPGGDASKVASIARQIHKITRELQDEIRNGGKAPAVVVDEIPKEEPKPAKKATPAKKQVTAVVEDYNFPDDDIPF